MKNKTFKGKCKTCLEEFEIKGIKARNIYIDKDIKNFKFYGYCPVCSLSVVYRTPKSETP